MPKSPGAINGAIGLRDNKIQHPIIVIKIASIDKALKKIKNSGGKLYTSKVAVGPIGFYAKIKDTEGTLVIAFFVINGTGKTTSIAKLAYYFQQHKISVVLAACDTFRAAAIQQLEEHADKLGIKLEY